MFAVMERIGKTRTFTPILVASAERCRERAAVLAGAGHSVHVRRATASMQREFRCKVGSMFVEEIVDSLFRE